MRKIFAIVLVCLSFVLVGCGDRAIVNKTFKDTLEGLQVGEGCSFSIGDADEEYLVIRIDDEINKWIEKDGGLVRHLNKEN